MIDLLVTSTVPETAAAMENAAGGTSSSVGEAVSFQMLIQQAGDSQTALFSIKADGQEADLEKVVKQAVSAVSVTETPVGGKPVQDTRNAAATALSEKTGEDRALLAMLDGEVIQGGENQTKQYLPVSGKPLPETEKKDDAGAGDAPVAGVFRNDPPPVAPVAISVFPHQPGARSVPVDGDEPLSAGSRPLSPAGGPVMTVAAGKASRDEKIGAGESVTAQANGRSDGAILQKGLEQAARNDVVPHAVSADTKTAKGKDATDDQPVDVKTVNSASLSLGTDKTSGTHQFHAVNGTQPKGGEGAVAQQAVRAPLGHEAWRKEMAHHLMDAVRDGRHQLQLRLHPDTLGAIDVNLRHDGNGTQVHFSTAHSQVKEALEAALPRLRELFNDSGMALLDASVSHHGNQNSSRGEGFGGGGFNGGAQGAGADAGEEETMVLHIGGEAGRDNLGLVDYYA